MPSKKVVAAVLGKVAPVSKPKDGGSSSVRFSVVPDDPKLARVQEDLRAQSDNAFKGTPFKEGKLIELDFANGLEQTVPHGLRGPIAGFIVCDLVGVSAAVAVFREDEQSSAAVEFGRSDTHVKFRATGSCQAKIWVWR